MLNISKKIMLLLLLMSLFACGSFKVRGDYTGHYLETYDSASELYKEKKYKKSFSKYKKAIAQQIVSSPEIIDAHLKIAEILAFRFSKFESANETLNELEHQLEKVEKGPEKRKIQSQIKEIRRKISRKYRQVRYRRKRAYKRRNTAKAKKIYSRAYREYRRKRYVAAYMLFKKIEAYDYRKTGHYLDILDDKVRVIVQKLFRQGLRYYSDSKNKLAVKKFNQVLKIWPNHKEALYYNNKAKRKLQVLESM